MSTPKTKRCLIGFAISFSSFFISLCSIKNAVFSIFNIIKIRLVQKTALYMTDLLSKKLRGLDVN